MPCEKEYSSGSDYSSRDGTESITDSEYYLEDETSSYKTEAPTPSRAIRPIYPSYRNRRMSSQEFEMRLNHQSNLNFEHPYLNFNGMMWFRDDDVLINQSLRSILTVYQPLYDPRDFNDMKLFFDMNDPFLLRLYHPNVPTYMHRDVENIHYQELENDPTNSEIYSFTAKTHMEVAKKVAKSDSNKMQITYFRLPFCVSCEQFSNIDNTRGEAEKHYRKIRVMVTEKITDTCSYIFWKILIEEEEANHLRAKRPTVRDEFDEAEERLSKMCKTTYLKH